MYGEVQRRAGPVVRGQAELVAGFYLETLRERLSSEKSDGLAAHLPKKLAGHLEGGGGGGEFSVWEFYERFAQKAGLAPEMAAYYARHVGDVLSGAVPQEELDTVREELPPDYWELSERVLADPHRYGSFERKSNPLEAADAPMQKKS